VPVPPLPRSLQALSAVLSRLFNKSQANIVYLLSCTSNFSMFIGLQRVYDVCLSPSCSILCLLNSTENRQDLGIVSYRSEVGREKGTNLKYDYCNSYKMKDMRRPAKGQSRPKKLPSPQLVQQEGMNSVAPIVLDRKIHMSGRQHALPRCRPHQQRSHPWRRTNRPILYSQFKNKIP